MRIIAALIFSIMTTMALAHEGHQVPQLDTLIKFLNEGITLDSQTPVCSEESPIKQSDKCEDFYSYACNGQTFSQLDLVNKLTDSFLISLAENSPDDEVAQTFRDTENLDFEELMDWLSENPDQWQASVNQAEESALNSVQITQKDLMGMFNEAKNELIAQLEELPITQEEKNLLTTPLRKIQLLRNDQAIDYLQKNFIRILQEKEMDASEFEELTEEERRAITLLFTSAQCGLGGTNLNVLTVPKEIIFICPGTFHHMKENLKHDSKAILKSLKFIIGHELGHSLIDELKKNPLQEKLASKYLDCMREGGLGFEGLDNLSDEERNTLVTNQATELFSDLWAQKLFEVQLSQLKLEPEKAADYLAEGLRFFCSEETTENPNSSHPTGLMRITLASRNPEFRKAIGCPAPTPENPACTLNGRVPSPAK